MALWDLALQHDWAPGDDIDRDLDREQVTHVAVVASIDVSQHRVGEDDGELLLAVELSFEGNDGGDDPALALPGWHRQEGPRSLGVAHACHGAGVLGVVWSEVDQRELLCDTGLHAAVLLEPLLGQNDAHLVELLLKAVAVGDGLALGLLAHLCHHSLLLAAHLLLHLGPQSVHLDRMPGLPRLEVLQLLLDLLQLHLLLHVLALESQVYHLHLLACFEVLQLLVMPRV